MRLLQAWPWLLAACALAIAVLAVTAGAPEPPPSEGDALPSDGVLPSTFVCLVEAPNDMHLA
jgi:hypothetical protein